MAATTKIWADNNPPTLNDDDLNGFKEENNNLILGSGQALTTSDRQQTNKAVAHYAAGGDYYQETGAADAYVLAPTGAKTAPPAYFTGMRIRFVAGNVNTGASTINVAGLGVKALVSDTTGGGLTAGEISDTIISEAYYDGTSFRLIAKITEIIKDTYAEVRALESTLLTDNTTCSVTGTSIFGVFVLDKTDAASVDNGATIIVDADSGRWHRRYYGAVSFGWFEPTGNGVASDQTAFTNAIAWIDSLGGGTLHFQKPSVSYMLDANSPLCDNLHLIFDEGVVFDALAGWASVAQMFRVWDLDNILIDGYGAKIQMTPYSGSGAQRHGVDMRGASNITINGLASNNCGGDGFYIGNGVLDPFCTNIVLREVSGDANSRQGLSITSVKGCKVINPRFTNTAGNAPESGIDIEPDANEEFIQGVEIINPYTEGNNGAGIEIALHVLPGAVDQDVSVSITDHHDIGSTRGFRVGRLNVGANTVKGSIKYSDGTLTESGNAGISIYNFDSDGPSVNIPRPTVLRPNQLNSADPKAGSGITVFRNAADGGATSIGNVRIKEPKVIDNDAAPQMINDYYFIDSDSDSLVNVDVVDIIESEGAQTNQMDHRGSGVVTDPREILSRDVTASFSVAESNWFRLIHNASQVSGTAVGSLDVGFQADSPNITFEVRAAQTLRIDPDVTSSIVPYGNGAGKYLESNTIGNKITIRRVDATTWKVVDIVGTWTAEP